MEVCLSATGPLQNPSASTFVSDSEKLDGLDRRGWKWRRSDTSTSSVYIWTFKQKKRYYWDTLRLLTWILNFFLFCVCKFTKRLVSSWRVPAVQNVCWRLEPDQYAQFVIFTNNGDDAFFILSKQFWNVSKRPPGTPDTDTAGRVCLRRAIDLKNVLKRK